MTDGILFIEKRKYKRVEKELNVSYKLVPKDNIKTFVSLEGKTKDISTGGIRISGDPLGEVGDVIRIEVGFEGADIITFAEIKWIRSVNGAKQFGIEFLVLKNEDKEKIQKLVN